MNKNETLNWPATETYFTIKDLVVLNPTQVEITLRTKVTKAINNNTVTLIGHKNQKKGRPSMILAMTPVSEQLIRRAYDDGVMPVDKVPSLAKTTTIPVSTITPINSTDVPCETDVLDVIKDSVIA